MGRQGHVSINFLEMFKKDRITKTFYLLLWVSAFFLLIGIDQYFKAHAGQVFLNNQFAFSLPLPLWVMYSIYAVVLAIAGYFCAKNFSKFGLGQKAGWLLVWAGAFANVGERITYGQVRDWIYIANGVFNLADGFILLGILILWLVSSQEDSVNPQHNQ